MKKYSIAIAGTTSRTQQCANSLFQSELFEISWILTPVAKPVGRKQILTPNPMELFATEHKIQTVFVENKINEIVKNQIIALEKPDFLLVVDFGYIIPQWLLDVPSIAPLNIHPSELPKWRGSSPGQFALLFNETNSAVTLMVMDSKLDHGPIIHQDFFTVDQAWDQSDYYAHAFDLMCTNLDTKIATFAEKYTNPKTKHEACTQQPDASPTITAKLISKDETFISWDYIKKALEGLFPEKNGEMLDENELKNSQLSIVLQEAVLKNQSVPLTIERATKAFANWPQVWTLVNTNQGEKRMKLLEAEYKSNKLVLLSVQIEGKNPTSWNDVRNSILD